ncbi:MAG: cyanophycinase [Bdellovibrionaceae bacterium]|nr:cyanophycinase [Pseudobdellovibrionaceae bacterium]
MFFVFSSSAFASEKLVLLGGSDQIPHEALEVFTNWSDGQKAKILFISWATKDPIYMESIKKQFLPYLGSNSIISAVNEPNTIESKTLFFKQLENSTGVFFYGGDQARILAILEDQEIKAALVEKFKMGTPFAGTSAGTAIMSKIAIVGEKTSKNKNFEKTIIVSEGLGLLPENIIVDQHFLERNREDRLKKVMSLFPGTMGVGIDEPTGLIIKDGLGMVVGLSLVSVYNLDSIIKLNNGEYFRLY